MTGYKRKLAHQKEQASSRRVSHHRHGDSTKEVNTRRTPFQRRMCVDFRRQNKQLPEVKNMSEGKVSVVR